MTRPTKLEKALLNTPTQGKAPFLLTRAFKNTWIPTEAQSSGWRHVQTREHEVDTFWVHRAQVAIVQDDPARLAFLIDRCPSLLLACRGIGESLLALASAQPSLDCLQVVINQLDATVGSDWPGDLLEGALQVASANSVGGTRRLLERKMEAQTVAQAALVAIEVNRSDILKAIVDSQPPEGGFFSKELIRRMACEAAHFGRVEALELLCPWLALRERAEAREVLSACVQNEAALTWTLRQCELQHTPHLHALVKVRLLSWIEECRPQAVAVAGGWWLSHMPSWTGERSKAWMLDAALGNLMSFLSEGDTRWLTIQAVLSLRPWPSPPLVRVLKKWKANTIGIEKVWVLLAPFVPPDQLPWTHHRWAIASQHPVLLAAWERHQLERALHPTWAQRTVKSARKVWCRLLKGTQYFGSGRVPRAKEAQTQASLEGEGAKAPLHSTTIASQSAGLDRFGQRRAPRRTPARRL